MPNTIYYYKAFIILALIFNSFAAFPQSSEKQESTQSKTTCCPGRCCPLHVPREAAAPAAATKPAKRASKKITKPDNSKEIDKKKNTDAPIFKEKHAD